VNGGNDNNRDADYEFECKGIDDYDLWRESWFWGNGEMLDGGVHCVKPGKSYPLFRKRLSAPSRGHKCPF